MRFSPEWVAYAAGAALLLGVGMGFSHEYHLKIGIERRGERVDDSAYQPHHRLEVGDQLVMVYVGSSTCGWSNRPGLAEAVKAIKVLLEHQARESGLSFMTKGVALEWSTAHGIEHLAKVGRFDEVSAGYNWGNEFALAHLWSDRLEPPSTPQVLVYRRTFTAPRSAEDEMAYRESERRLLLVKRGFSEITEWAEVGAPLADVEVIESL